MPSRQVSLLIKCFISVINCKIVKRYQINTDTKYAVTLLLQRCNAQECKYTLFLFALSFFFYKFAHENVIAYDPNVSYQPYHILPIALHRENSSGG